MPRAQTQLPEPTPAQAHPQPHYTLTLRYTHAEAERIKAAVALRVTLGAWAPETETADWVLLHVVTQIMDAQGVTPAQHRERRDIR